MADLIIAVYRRALDQGWPWDLGDDPSFEASARASGQITWGVCRPPVRNAVSVGDLVVFFAGGRKVPCTYQFVGFATVDQKISRDKIWTLPEFATYRSYRNILIRPEPDGFRHVEQPHFDQRIWHPDWLCRIAHPSQRKHPDFDRVQRSDFLPEPICAQNTAISLADNYVIFRREGDGTFVADRPPTVATAEKNGAHEVWRENDPFAVQLRTKLFSGSPRGWLRSTHRQISHPHIRLKDVDTVALAQELLDLCSSFGIASRGSGSFSK